MTQDGGKTEQLQGDHEGRRGFTTKSGGMWEKLYAAPGFGIWMGNFRDIMTDEQANAAISAFIAKKIRQRVTDPQVAEKLIPQDHGFGSRRVPLESGYFEAYNRDN